MMVAYENDNLVIPETYKKMSVSELEKEKAKALKEIKTSKSPKGKMESNNNIVFKF